MNTNDLIDGKYLVLSVLNNEGGMGTLLRVRDESSGEVVALKFCKLDDPESRARFRREARLMLEFKGNSKVVQLIGNNLDYDPPYFVMPIYTSGDLRTLSHTIQGDETLQEQLLLQMAECVQELHLAGKFHRDIKPANFLRTEDGICISDLGLGMDTQSNTVVTLSQQWAGTQGYVPPEFYHHGGFKNATCQSDIFMLGKTIYNILSGLDPQYIDKTALKKPISIVVDRCCQQEPPRRFTNVGQLKQAIVSAYDIILNRMMPLGEAKSKYTAIIELLDKNKYKADDVKAFIGLVSSLAPAELFSIVSASPKSFYQVLSLPPFEEELKIYLQVYDEAVKSQPFLDFSYAEHIADRMKVIFNSSEDAETRSVALTLAIRYADGMNRFAAINTCSLLIIGVRDDDPAAPEIVNVLNSSTADFIKSIEPSSCKNTLIGNAIYKIKNS